MITSANQVEPGVTNGIVERVEEVSLVGEVVEGSDRLEHPSVSRSCSL